MAMLSKALRGLLAKEYNEVVSEEQMASAATIAPRASAADHLRLGLLQLLLPDLVAAVEDVIVNSTDNAAARGMAGGLLTYVCNPLDIIGDEQPLGRVDDTIICAIGLRRLQELEHVPLPPRVEAACDVAASCLCYLSEDLQESIEEFVAELEASTRSSARS